MSASSTTAAGTATPHDRTTFLVDVLCRLYVENGGRWVSVNEWSTASSVGLAELWTLLSSAEARPHDELGVQQHGGQSTPRSTQSLADFIKAPHTATTSAPVEIVTGEGASFVAYDDLEPGAPRSPVPQDDVSPVPASTLRSTLVLTAGEPCAHCLRTVMVPEHYCGTTKLAYIVIGPDDPLPRGGVRMTTRRLASSEPNLRVPRGEDAHRVPYGEGIHTSHPLYRVLEQLDGVRAYALKRISPPIGVSPGIPADLARVLEYKLDQVAAEIRRIAAKIRLAGASPRREVVEAQPPNE